MKLATLALVMLVGGCCSNGGHGSSSGSDTETYPGGATDCDALDGGAYAGCTDPLPEAACYFNGVPGPAPATGCQPAPEHNDPATLPLAGTWCCPGQEP